MNTSLVRAVGGIGLTLSLAGCMVDERMAWSPDGSRAAVWGPAGLFLADPDGRLGGPLVTGVTTAVWMPGDRELVVLREIPVRRWAEVAERLHERDRRRIEALAPVVAEALRGVLSISTNGLAGADEEFLKPLGLAVEPAAVTAALLCLRDTLPEPWSNLVVRAGTHDLTPESGPVITVYELSVVRADSNAAAVAVQPLFRSFRPITALRASPLTRAVAFRVGRALWAMPVEEGPVEPTLIAERVSGRFDWSPDASALTYVVPVGGAEDTGLHLGHVQSTTLRREGERFAPGATVAHCLAAFPYPPRLRYLGDGRLVFPAIEASLPRAVSGPETAGRATLFLARWTPDSAERPRLEPLTTPNALPADLRDFEPSPDGRRIAIVESGSDVVAVLDVADGRLQVVQPAGRARTRALPVWRTPDELYFAALPSADGPPEWRRWTNGDMRTWSAGWPTGLVARLLETPPR